MYHNINEINNKYSLFFDYIKGCIKGNKFIQYLLIEKVDKKEYKSILKVNKKTKKEIFISIKNN